MGIVIVKKTAHRGPQPSIERGCLSNINMITLELIFVVFCIRVSRNRMRTSASESCTVCTVWLSCSPDRQTALPPSFIYPDNLSPAEDHWLALGSNFPRVPTGNRTAALLSVRVHSTCHYGKLLVRETAWAGRTPPRLPEDIGVRVQSFHQRVHRRCTLRSCSPPQPREGQKAKSSSPVLSFRTTRAVESRERLV